MLLKRGDVETVGVIDAPSYSTTQTILNPMALMSLDAMPPTLPKP